MSISKIILGVVVTLGIIHFSGATNAQANFEGIWYANHPEGMGQPPLEELAFTSAGRAAFDRFGADNDPSFRCVMPGVPRGLVDPYPREIIQQGHQIVLLHEYYHQVRRIYMDGREAPEYWPLSLSGYSTGHWEDETLVVRTTHLSPDNLMTTTGRPFSGNDNTYVIERYTRSGDVLMLTAEIHDPTYYEETYVMHGLWNFTPDGEIWEYVCDPSFGNVA